IVRMHSAIQKMNSLKLNKGVKYVQNNHIATRSVEPDDAKYEDQWAPVKIKLPDAWAYTTGGTTQDGDEIVIAVIDQGLRAQASLT
ncbi:MAG TPA: hypothetical protein PLJ08_03815, partial [Cyclobacteriaceae bacterium]|nr:hypothetical protein [Cyclobacteriaceae bacterium]